MKSFIDLRSHIILPFIEPAKSELDYRDLLTYLAVRSFWNSSNGACYPSQRTIETTSGLSFKFVNGSIKRLEKAKVFTITPGLSNHYGFPKVELYSSVPADFLLVPDLTTTEKAFILCILKFFNISLIVPAKFSPKDVAELTGLNIRTVKKHLESIIQKGYLKKGKNPDDFQLTDKFDWNVYDHSSLTDIPAKRLLMLKEDDSTEPEIKPVVDRPELLVK